MKKNWDYFLFIFCLSCLVLSCKNVIQGETNVEQGLNIDNFESSNDVTKYVERNILNLKIYYDRDNDLCYSDVGKLHIVFIIRGARIIGDSIFLPYSYSINGEFYSSSVFYPIKKNNAGILLSMDDYYRNNWEIYLSFFRKKGVKVTFFCMGDIDRLGVVEFCKKAEAMGMECGYHTKTHKFLSNVTIEELHKEAIDPLKLFYDIGIDFNSFAFPGGGVPLNSDKSINKLYIEELKKYYKILRASGKSRTNWIYSKDEIKNEDFIYGQSLDKISFPTKEKFCDAIMKNLIITKITGNIYCCFAHYIRFRGELLKFSTDHYTTSLENFEFFFDQIKKLKMKSYLYKDFY